MNTPMQAVDAFVKQHHSGMLAHVIVLPDKADANGGYFMAAQIPHANYERKYFVFYLHRSSGRWTVQNPPLGPMSVAKPNGPILKGYAVNNPTTLAIVSTRVNSNIGAIVGCKRHKIPFSFVQIGHLPLWAYKFTNSNVKVGMSQNDIAIYNQDGELIYPASHA